MTAGLSIYIDGVRDVAAESPEEFHVEATNLEAEVESVIAEALSDHSAVEVGATVSAEYIQEDDG